MLKYYISKVVDKMDLDEQEAFDAMNIIMDGGATASQVSAFITALRMKGETLDEITGCARSMRKHCDSIRPRTTNLLDTCGTGGDGMHTINISTAAAFVAAGGGVAVAKHGNRSVSSKCGSADVLEAMGIEIGLNSEAVAECIDNVGIGFMFAPNFHKSMKHAAPTRREIGIRTVFNMVGPLTNPANAANQVLGVYRPDLVKPIAEVLLKLGAGRALVVHAEDGMDEISLTGITYFAEIRNGKVKTGIIDPETLGMGLCNSNALKGGSAEENARIIREVFEGKPGPCRDVIVLNAAAALYVSGKAMTLSQGVRLAIEIIDTGKAKQKVEALSRFTKSIGGVA